MDEKRLRWEAEQCSWQVREILNEDWDPIGVRDFGVEDEYDNYIDAIVALLMREDGLTFEVMAAHLWWLATERIGMSPRSQLWQKCDNTAAALIRLQPRY